MKMDGSRQQLFIGYMHYLHETDRFDATKARYAKHVLGFLESASSSLSYFLKSAKGGADST